jgi:hypothetical protein
VNDLVNLDAAEPVRLHWTDRPSGHPFFAHKWAKQYPNIFFLPWSAQAKARLRNQPASALARITATPDLVSLNSKAEEFLLERIDQHDAAEDDPE